MKLLHDAYLLFACHSKNARSMEHKEVLIKNIFNLLKAFIKSI